MKYLFCLLLAFTFRSAYAQNKIQGIFDPRTQSFKTGQNSYWIDFFNHGRALIYSDGYVGLMDSTGAILIEPKYDNISSFIDSVAIVGLNNRVGVIDLYGKEILPPVYSSVKIRAGQPFILENARLFGLADKTGKIIKEPFAESISAFQNGFAIFQSAENHKKGVLNEKGKVEMKPEHYHLRQFTDERFIAINDSTVRMLPLHGRETLLFQNTQASREVAVGSSDSEFFVQIGEEYIPILRLKQGKALMVKKMGQDYLFGFIDETGSAVIPFEYERIGEFANGFAKAKQKGKWGVIDTKGKTIIPFVYHFVEVVDSNRFIVAVDSSFGAVDSLNKKVLPLKYKALHYLFDDLYMISGKDSSFSKEKWGVVNLDGDTILSFLHDAVIKTGEHIGVATLYVSSTPLNTGIPRYIYHGKYFLFNKEGRIDTVSYPFSHTVEAYSDFYDPGDLYLPPEGNSPHFGWGSPPGYGMLALPGFGTEVRNRDSSAFAQYDYVKKIAGRHSLVTVVAKDLLTDPNKRIFWQRQQMASHKGIINADGDTVVPLIYSDITYAGSNIFVVCQNDKWGVVNLFNEVVVPVEYNNVRIISGVIVAIKTSRTQEGDTRFKSTVFDMQGNVLIPQDNYLYEETAAGSLLQRKAVFNSPSYLIDKSGRKIE